MTVELYDQGAADAEVLVISWLTPFFSDLSGKVDIKRRAGDPLPFGLVREVTNTEQVQQMSAYPVVSVHWLAASADECRSLSRLGHRRMLVLANDPLTVIDVGGGELQNVEWLETVHAPEWVDYANDQIFHRVSRYRMGIPFIPEG